MSVLAVHVCWVNLCLKRALLKPCFAETWSFWDFFGQIFCKNRCFSHFDSLLTAANRILENGPSTATLPSARGSVRSNISTASSPSSSSSGDLPPLPNQWAETQDAHTGRIYFIDHLTRTTQWERPKALPSNWERRLDQEQNRIYRVILLKCNILHSRGKSSFWGGKSHSGSVLVKKFILGHFRPFLGKKSSFQVIFGHFRDIFFNTTLYRVYFEILRTLLAYFIIEDASKIS